MTMEQKYIQTAIDYKKNIAGKFVRKVEFLQ